MIDILKDKYYIRDLCRTLKCSKSGYYDWITLGRPEMKKFDKIYNDVVMEIYEKDKTKGIRRIRMELKKVYGLIVTNYTIYRYMRLNGVQSITRRKTHTYPKVDRHDIPNLLHRNFNTDASNKKWSIDISYIFARNGLKYLCAIKDMYDKSIIAHKISPFIDLKLVTETVELAIKRVPVKERKSLILHSDQGWHFTNYQYIKLLQDNGITQSISARGSSVDNVPIESFFSILKSECIYLIDNLYKDDIETVVNNIINYYNNDRLQEKIEELAPNDFRKLTLSASF